MKVIAERDTGWFECKDGCEKQTEWSQYDQLCRAYGVEFEVVNELTSLDGNIVVFDEKGTILLEDFQHDEDALYVFGRSDVGRDLVGMFPDSVSVRIGVPNPVSMFGICACAIVLEDRRRKWWSP